MKKWICLLLCTCLLCGCVPADPYEGSGDPAASERTPCIAVLLKSMGSAYFNLIKAGAEAEADALGVQVMVVFPQKEIDTDEQSEMLRTLAKMSVDVIAVSPVHVPALQDGLELAYENGKKLMAIDSPLSYPNCSCSIGTDQYSSAYEQGTYAAGLVPPGSNAVILRGQQEDKAHDLREYGLRDALHNNGVQTLDVRICNSSEEDAAQAMQELLDMYPDIDLVCSTADIMAVGAQPVIEQSGRTISIVSFDGMKNACELVRDGKMDATFAQDPYLMGQLCVRNAVKLIQGEEVPQTIYTDIECIDRFNAQSHIDTLAGYLKRQNIVQP